MIPPHPDLRLIKAGRADPRPGGVDLFTVCRNEARLLPHFLAHYRSLGVDRIYVIDNGSEDDTSDVLAGMDDVWYFYTEGHYFNANDGCDWACAVMEQSLKDARMPDRWGIFADADELLAYPGFEDIPLPYLITSLEAQQAEGLFAFMLDFYAPTLFDAEPYRPGTPFLQAAPHFDGTGYTAGLSRPGQTADAQSPRLFIRGGVRARLVDWAAVGRHKPVLRKVPLARARSGTAPWLGSHAVSARRLTGMTGALLHFKFLGKTYEQLRSDVLSGQRGAHQVVYETYLRLFESGPPDPVVDGITETWRDSLQLVELGLCALPKQAVNSLTEAVRAQGGIGRWLAVLQRLRAASEAAQNRFAVAPGHAFQTLRSY